MEHQTTRINGAMLSSYQGRNVCILGMAKNVDQNGTSFTLTTCDGKDVKVALQDPISDYVGELTEVQGTINGNCIQCKSYITFPKETSETFNMDLYNAAVELTVRAPQHYQQGIQSR